MDWVSVLSHDPDLMVTFGDNACPGTTAGADLTVHYMGKRGYPLLLFDRVAYGDLDADGIEEAVISLSSACTGSSSYASLMYRATPTGPKLIGAGPSNDHLLQVVIENKIVVATGEVYLDGDAGCCPSGGTRITQYRLQGGQLVEISSRDIPPATSVSMPAATARLSPSSGSPGTKITFQVTGWISNTPFSLVMLPDDAKPHNSPGPIFDDGYRTDNVGHAQITFTLPTNVGAGQWRIHLGAKDANVGEGPSTVFTVTASLTVTPAPTAATVTSGELVYISPAGDLSVANTNGTNIRKLVSGPVEKPVWSHDGKRIAYLHRLGEQYATQIEVVNADGSERTMVVAPKANPRAAATSQQYVRVRWAGDDSALYYAYSYGNSSGHGIVRHELKGGAERDLNIYAWDFDVAKDGTFVILDYDNTTGKNNISLVSNGGKPQTLVTGDGLQGPTWSPDGSRIDFRDSGIRVISRDKKQDQRVQWPESAPINLAWSSDGRFVLFGEPSSSNGSYALYRVALPNGMPQRLFAGRVPVPRP